MGNGFVIETLRKTYGDIEVTDDAEAAAVESVEWPQEQNNSRTPGEVLGAYRDNAGIRQDKPSELSGIATKLAEALKCGHHRLILD